MNFPIDKYRFYVTKDKVIAVSTYAGKTVRGVAKCAPGDTFNVEIGKQLAAARCNEKIAKKRHERAKKKYIMAVDKASAAVEEAQKMKKYNEESFLAYNQAAIAVDVMVDALAEVQNG